VGQFVGGGGFEGSKSVQCGTDLCVCVGVIFCRVWDSVLWVCDSECVL